MILRSGVGGPVVDVEGNVVVAHGIGLCGVGVAGVVCPHGVDVLDGLGAACGAQERAREGHPLVFHQLDKVMGLRDCAALRSVVSMCG